MARDITFNWTNWVDGFDSGTVTWDGLKTATELGGFANKVYRDENHGYAVKEYKVSNPAAFSAVLESAEQEYQKLFELRGCDGAAQVLACGFIVREDDNNFVYPVLVEEWVEGDRLDEGFEKSSYYGGVAEAANADVVVETRLAVATAVARALANVADRAVANRDLAPTNVIVLRRPDGSFHATIIDFGQASRDEDSVTPAELARLAQWQFGAPEMYGGEFYDWRNKLSVDVWSLGALCWYALSGGRDWPRLGSGTPSRELAVERKRALDGKGLPEGVRAQFGPVGASLSAIVRDCLRFDPTKRPAAREVADRLQSCLYELRGDDKTPPLSDATSTAAFLTLSATVSTAADSGESTSVETNEAVGSVGVETYNGSNLSGSGQHNEREITDDLAVQEQKPPAITVVRNVRNNRRFRNEVESTLLSKGELANYKSWRHLTLASAVLVCVSVIVNVLFVAATGEPNLAEAFEAYVDNQPGGALFCVSPVICFIMFAFDLQEVRKCRKQADARYRKLTKDQRLFVWNELHAKQGEAAAQCDLGCRYCTGEGVARNYEAAVYWFRRAAEQEHAVAEHNLGACYASGSGVAQDDTQAAFWFGRAAAHGYDERGNDAHR